MDGTSPQLTPGNSPEDSSPPVRTAALDTSTAPGQAAPVKKRRGGFRWIFIPLLIVGVGFVGYRLGQSGTSSSASTPGGFGAPGGATGGASGASGSRSGGTAGGGNTATGGGPAGNTVAGGTAPSAGAAAGATTSATGTGTGRGSRSSAGAASGSAGNSGAGSNSAFSGIVTPVQAAAVKAGTLRTERRLTGTVSASQTATVNSQTSGTISDIARNVGDSVGAGQTVLTLINQDLSTSVQSAQNALDSAQAQLESQQAQVSAGTANLQAAVTSAQTSLQNAQSSLASLQQLYGVGAVARSEVQAQEVQVQQARSSLVSAQTNLSSTQRTNNANLTTARLNVQKAQIALNQARDAASAVRVVAPFDGQITAMNVAAGQYLTPSTAAFTVVSTQKEVKVNVPSTEASSLPVGAALTFVVGQQKYPLKVTQNAGATAAGSVPITARFLETAAPQGTVGSVVYIAKVATGVLVPSTALQVDGDTTYVFTVENNKAKQHTVTVLGQAGTQSAVSGVEAGSQVISQPPTGLLDGASVTTSNSTRSSSQEPGAGGPPGGMP